MGTKPAKVGHLAATLLRYVQNNNNNKLHKAMGFEPRSKGGEAGA